MITEILYGRMNPCRTGGQVVLPETNAPCASKCREIPKGGKKLMNLLIL
jgi:hypothetical protein